MRQITKKLNKKTFLSTDIDVLKSKISAILTNKEEGYVNFSNDDIENLNIFQELLKYYEKNQKRVSLQKSSELDYDKTKLILDELALNQIISGLLGGIGWFFEFQIIDMVRFRDYLYKRIEEIMSKLPGGFKFSNLKTFLEPTINKVLAGLIVTILSGLLVLVIWEMIPQDSFKTESYMDIDVATKGLRDCYHQFGRENCNDIFNPLAQDLNFTKLHLWLQNKGGDTVIYTESILVTAEHFWTSFLPEEQYELKPGQTISIPLNFKPNDSYWKKVSDSERENPQFIVKVKVAYSTKGKTRTRELNERILMDSINEYYERYNETLTNTSQVP